MLASIACSAIYMAFLIIVAVLDHKIGRLDEPKLTNFYTMYLYMAKYFMFKLCNEVGSRIFKFNLKKNI